MALYARPSWQLGRQITFDVFVLAWTIGWAVVGRAVTRMIDAVADPARGIVDTLGGLETNMEDAATGVEKVPLVGGGLRSPFDGAATQLGDLGAATVQQIELIERVAAISGWCVFLIPVLGIIAFWLPYRVSFHRRSSSAQRFIDSGADLDLFALRAMANQPMHVLAQISPDPVRDWREGDRRVIGELADVELRRSGLRPPERRSGLRLPEGRRE